MTFPILISSQTFTDDVHRPPMHVIVCYIACYTLFRMGKFGSIVYPSCLSIIERVLDYLADEKIPPLTEPMQDNATKMGNSHQIGPRAR